MAYFTKVETTDDGTEILNVQPSSVWEGLKLGYLCWKYPDKFCMYIGVKDVEKNSQKAHGYASVG